MTLGELSHWCHEHLDVPPENERKMKMQPKKWSSKNPLVKEAQKRGRPPLTEDQKEKNVAKKAATKAAKRAKKDYSGSNVFVP